jgi:flagellar L-ring protein precursor FlgH
MMRTLRSPIRWAALAVLVVAAPARGQEAAGDAPAIRAPRVDWTADRRRFVEGDIVTVLVDEYTLASANKSAIASRQRTRQTSLSGGYGVDASGADIDAGIRSGSSGESRHRGQTTRSDRLTSEITARVVAVEASGVLRLEGRKRMVIDDHEQEITLRGFVRPEDISPRNVVDSWRLADAEISYESNGKLDRPSGGLITRVLGWLWP